MKNINQKSYLILALIFAVFSQASNAVDCLPLNTTITLNTQTLVDDFYTDHGVCDTIVGGLTIEGSDITDLSNLSSLTSVSEKLTLLSLESLISFTGLSNMTSVGALEIDGNDSFVDLSLLSNLQQIVSGDIIIVENNNMISLAGLENLQQMSPNFKMKIFSNPELISLQALSNLQIGLDEIEILSNDKLTNLNGLSGIQGYIYNLLIENNNNLSSLTGLGDITDIDNTIRIFKNLSLSDISVFSSMVNVQGDIELIDLAITDVNALSNLTISEGSVTLDQNANLANLNGLSSLQEIHSDLIVTDNPLLRNCIGIVRLVDTVDDYDPGPGSGAVPDISAAINISGNHVNCNSIQNILDFKIIYVDENTPAGGSCAIGECWDNAYSNLQDALTVAIIGEIWVAQGVYYPDVGGSELNDDQQASFVLVDGVSIYGGFDATETSIIQRNPIVNITVLSGDIDGNDTNNDGNNIAESVDDHVGANTYQIIKGSGLDVDDVIDGFTVTAGRADGANPLNQGAGMFCASATISPTVDNMIFIGNYASLRGGALIYCAENVLNSKFISNKSEGSAIYAQGGNFSNVIFKNNESFRAGALTNSLNHIYLENSSFINNSATSGVAGAFYNEKSYTTLHNVLFLGNYAVGAGGALYTVDQVEMINVTMTGNKSDSIGGAIGGDASSSFQITNTIIWNNLDSSGQGTASASISSDINMQYVGRMYDLIQGLGLGGSGNLDEDPLFITDVNPANAPNNQGNARLMAVSNAINAGSNNVVSTNTDLDGRERIVNGRVDMGAYEYTDVIFANGFD